MKKERKFLVLNPGSSSEKFSFFVGTKEVLALYFEGVEEDGNKKFICTLMEDGKKEILKKRWDTLAEAFAATKEILEKKKLITPEGGLDGILVRVVAAGRYFSRNHIVDDETMRELEKVRTLNPLHVPAAERAIKSAREAFFGVPILAMSDSEALIADTRRDLRYALPKDEVLNFDLKRWGAHGASYGFVMDQIAVRGIVEERMVVCHLGSGCSATALVKGRPVYTSMGATPLEGLMSSTRSGSVDPTIGALLGEKYGAAKAIEMMNRNSGLQVIAGTNDMRQIVERVRNDDADALEVYDMFVDGVAGKIGEYAAKMGGIDGLIFTATMGERSGIIRNSIVDRLSFVGFKMRKDLDFDNFQGFLNAADEGSKPIYIMSTNEAAYMIKKAMELIDEVESGK